MPKASDLARLFHAIGSQDLSVAQSIALEMARAEEGKGHHSAAKLLLGSLRPNGRDDQASYLHSGELTPVHGILNALSLVTVSPSESLDRVALNSQCRDALTEILREWEGRRILETNGLRRRNKILLFGPPGCGKSLTARAIGKALSLPVYTLRFDAIVGAFLGQTAQRLGQLFEFASSTPCVLLIDEIDALGKRRGNPMEVGELDRIVISLLQELEHSEPRGLLVAATNLSRSLDEALWRRFDLVLELQKPSQRQLKLFAISRAHERNLPVSSRLVRSLERSLTYADAMRAIEAEQRTLLLSK